MTDLRSIEGGAPLPIPSAPPLNRESGYVGPREGIVSIIESINIDAPYSQGQQQIIAEQTHRVYMRFCPFIVLSFLPLIALVGTWGYIGMNWHVIQATRHPIFPITIVATAQVPVITLVLVCFLGSEVYEGVRRIPFSRSKWLFKEVFDASKSDQRRAQALLEATDDEIENLHHNQFITEDLLDVLREVRGRGILESMERSQGILSEKIEVEMLINILDVTENRLFGDAFFRATARHYLRRIDPQAMPALREALTCLNAAGNSARIEARGEYRVRIESEVRERHRTLREQEHAFTHSVAENIARIIHEDLHPDRLYQIRAAR